MREMLSVGLWESLTASREGEHCLRLFLSSSHHLICTDRLVLGVLGVFTEEGSTRPGCQQSYVVLVAECSAVNQLTGGPR